MESHDILSLSILENIMMEKHIDQNMSDSYQILREDLSNQNQEMILFSREFLHSPQSRFVDLVNDFDSRNHFSESKFMEKILANYQLSLSNNHLISSHISFSQKQKNTLQNQYSKILSNDLNFSLE